MKTLLLILSFFAFYVEAHAETDKDVLRQMDNTLKNAHCVPNQKDGKPAGYRCFQGSNETGKDDGEKGTDLRNGDVISEIDGEPAGSPSKAIEALDSKNGHNVTVKIKRQETVQVDESDSDIQPPK